jgi:chromosome segregation ATPase
MNEQQLSPEDQAALSKTNLGGLILALYIIPFWLLSFYAIWVSDRWIFFILALLMSSAGAFAIYLLLNRWENSLKPQEEEIPPPPSPIAIEADFTPYIQHIEALQQALQEVLQKQEGLEKENSAKQILLQNLHREKEQIEQQLVTVQQEYAVFQRNVHEQIEHHKALIAEQQRTIGELRDQLEKKQQYIQQLETKTRDLNYELKTLLQIAEKPLEIEHEAAPLENFSRADFKGESKHSIFSDFVVQTQEEAHVQLKRCLDIAQRIVGASHFGGNTRFKELTLDNFALDLRRLFDSLSEINAGTVVVYSPKEDKILFTNDKVRDLLGILPEKFMQSFHEVIENNVEEWRNAVRQLSFKNESKLNLTMTNKTGQEVHAECLLGMIPTGIFRNHAIGLIYPVKKEVTRFSSQLRPYSYSN